VSQASLVSKKTKQDAEADGGYPSWVEESIWTERMLTVLGNGMKGGKWFSLMDKVYRPSTLQRAWEKIASRKGAAGVDGQSIAKFTANSERYINELSESLRRHIYRPLPVRRVHIPKGNGQTRPLGIPTVKDRIVQTAVKMVIEPIFEREFLPMSFGFRPQKGCKDALREVDRLLKEGYTHVVDADLAGYFDSIPKDKLLARVGEKISDGSLLNLLQSWLEQDVMDDVKRWTPVAGTPQGAVISPLLANIYLHPLDVLITEQGFHMVRYADDFVILCQSAERASQALAEVQRWVEANGLVLHPEKTHVGNCLEKGQGFDFLGYRFAMGRRYVRRKSEKALRDKIRSKTKRCNGKSLAMIIASLNPMLRGWFEYFKHAHGWVFQHIDGFVRRRLRAILRKNEKRPGHGACRADHLRWRNIFFARQGLYTMKTAHAVACQSRC